MSDRVVLSVGTKRGLFVLESDSKRSSWKMTGPHLKGWAIYHATVDTRKGARIHAAASSDVFGTNTFSGDLKSKKFAGAKKPPVPPKLPAKGLKFAKKYSIPILPRVWHIEPARRHEPGVLYAGTAPAGLFRSEDSGKSWAPIDSINNHPTKKDWMPGAGGMCLHSIQVDPVNPDRMWIGISAAGSVRTDDGRKTWKPLNRGVKSFTGAVMGSETGTCVHKLLLHPAVPGRMFQQNHIGVYRSDDHGDSWTSIDKGLPSDFGFGLALDPNDGNACFVTPLQPEEYAWRATPGNFTVYRRGSKGWKAESKGLPGEGAYVNVLREGMSNDTLDPAGVYVGTGTGQLFASRDAGRSWKSIANYLPPILSVNATVV